MKRIRSAWRAELVKTLASKSWIWWGIAFFVVSGFVSALMGVTVFSFDFENPYGIISEEEIIKSVFSSPLTFCYTMAMAAGVGVYGKERRQLSLAMSFLITSNRTCVAISKYAVGMLLGVWFGLLYILGVLLGGGMIIFANDPKTIPAIAILKMLIIIIVLLMLWSLIGTGLGICLPMIPALLMGFALSVVIQLILSPIIGNFSWGQKIISLLPGVSTNLATKPLTGEFLTTWLPWWGNCIVLVLWALAISIIGVIIINHSEINVD